MELDSDLIRSLIASWKVSSSPEGLHRIRELVDNYIYFFPRMAYKAPHSLCVEFYLFVEPRLPSVLLSYPQDSLYRFPLWLNQALAFKYADFCGQPSLGLHRPTLPLEESLPSAEKAEEGESCPCLTEGERVFLLFCENPGRLSSEDLLVLTEFCRCEIPLVLECFGEACAFHEHRFERLTREEFTLGRIAEIRMRLKRRMPKSPPEKQSELKIKADRLENRRRHILNNQASADRQVGKIAALLMGSPEKARRVLSRIRQKIRYESGRQEPHAQL